MQPMMRLSHLGILLFAKEPFKRVISPQSIPNNKVIYSYSTVFKEVQLGEMYKIRNLCCKHRFHIICISRICNGKIELLNAFQESRKDSKNQESIQAGTTPVPGYQIGK